MLGAGPTNIFLLFPAPSFLPSFLPPEKQIGFFEYQAVQYDVHIPIYKILPTLIFY
jgi:hypothetical protein